MSEHILWETIKEQNEKNVDFEKQLKDLEWQLREVAKDNDYYQAENKRLEQQIEKMKICQNCKSEDKDYLEEPCSSCSRCLGGIKRKGTSDKWELQE